MSDTHEVTLLLAEWAKESQRALDDLTPLVYRELRQLDEYPCRLFGLRGKK